MKAYCINKGSWVDNYHKPIDGPQFGEVVNIYFHQNGFLIIENYPDIAYDPDLFIIEKKLEEKYYDKLMKGKHQVLNNEAMILSI